MNISKKEWFCYHCSLQFDSKHVYNLHLKLLHKGINAKRPYKNKAKSNESMSRDEKSVSNNQIASDQNEKKSFKCEICQYYSSHRGNLNAHIASVHEGRRKFKCELCNYTCSAKSDLNKHVASVHEGKKPFKCKFC